ncbi:MAG: hypothetical protein ACFFDN_45560 [Candidatus Hodarchaeota archaeon]
MDESLSLRFIGIGSKAIQARNSTDEGIIHGILLQNNNKELAIFISTISFRQNKSKNEENFGVIGGFTLEDLKKQLEQLKKQNWIPLGLIQIDIGEKAVEHFLKEDNKPFALINLINDVKKLKLNYERKKFEKNYLNYIL